MENFPFFSISEFNTACEEFESRSQKVDWNVVLVKASQEVREGFFPSILPWCMKLP